MLNTIEGHLPIISAFWICGVFCISFYRLFGFIHLHFIIRSIRDPIDALWEKRIRIWIKRLNIRQKVRILQSDRFSAPAVYGWLKPVILVPTSFLTGMDPKSVESIFIHELAHIRRYDFLVNMIQGMVEILGFFHPGVWWLSNRIRRERENCCDDWAVRMLGDKLIYVKSLVKLEETRHVPRPVLAITGSELSRRVMRILDYKSTKRSSVSVLTFVLSLSLISFLLFTGFTGFQLDENKELDFARLKAYMIAYYPFSKNANDASGSGMNGYVKGATLTEDRFGQSEQAYAFNGEENLIVVPVNKKFTINESITVSCWIKPERAAQYESWVAMVYPKEKGRSHWRTGFGTNKNTEWGFTETVTEGEQMIWFDFFVTDSEIPVDQWTHVTTVANQKTGEVVLYKNGRRVCSMDQLKPFSPYKVELLIGYQPDNAIGFKGSIDEVHIFNTALNDDEVNAVYKLN